VTQITFWGVTASPYQLKMQALADAAGIAWQRAPEQLSTARALGMAWRLRRAVRRQSIERLPRREAALDEYPSVPFYTLDGQTFYYDSSGLAYHLEQLGSGAPGLLPLEPGLRFACRLVDEAFDEFGLYMVHHNRWAVSAATNTMGEFTSREMRKLFPFGLHRRVARTLPRRQVRRCPYLFSVAPPGFDAGVSRELTPPALPGFPPTHDLLNKAWRLYLAAMETVLAQQPYLLGERFTLADASAYGQLAMNLVDGRAAQLLEQLAPRTFQWLCMIREGRHRASAGELFLDDRLRPLLDVIAETFMPLMRQNTAAYQAAVARGQTLFNEAAFDRGEALYDGTLMDQPFRAVARSFQVPVWRDLCQSWAALEESRKKALGELCPRLTDAAFAVAFDIDPGTT
jgi:glutathione S-transferase